MKKYGKYLVLGLVIVIAIILIFSDIRNILTLSALKGKQTEIFALYRTNPITTVLGYMGIYIFCTAFSLPGAVILTLAGGAVFGILWGTVIVSFSSTIGATFAFLVSRFVLRNAIQDKFSEKLVKINEGFKKEGAFFLFALRLIPIFPYFVVNLVMGVTHMPVLTFFWVSQLGMLLGTIAFVNAGTQLGQIHSVKGILSPGVLVSFAFLAIIPFVAKRLVQFFRSRKALAKFPSPRQFDYNIAVIGAGSGGLVSAYIASAVKAKVLLIERHRMGGDCLNTGCVPSKALIRSAKMLAYSKRAKEFGFREAKIDFSFSDVMNRVQRAISKVEPHDSMERYTGLGVECIKGSAKMLTPYSLQITGENQELKTVTAKNIIIAAGASPLVPPIKGLEKIKPLTSDNIWEIRNLPKRLVVLGGGPIGSELAQCFQRFGSQVTIVEMGSKIMAREDDDVSNVVSSRFQKEGVEILTGHKAKEIMIENHEKILICDSGSGEKKVPFDEVLIALGRKANLKDYGLEELDVPITPRGTVQVDEFLRTNYPNIYAVGDVAGPYQFTHTAAHMAWYASVNALFSPIISFGVDYRVVPWCTFTDPEVARVGLNEKEAKEKGISYSVSVYPLEDLDRAIADEEDHGMVKVLTVPGKDKILGATIVGSHAGDIIVEYVSAMKHGFGMNAILKTIHIYPTLGEANKYAAGVWKNANKPEATLRILEKFHRWRLC